MKPTVGFLILAMMFAGCATSRPGAHDVDATACAGGRTFAAGGERATLWVRQSAEYRAAAAGVYQAANRALGAALADPAWSAEPAQSGSLHALPAAVIMDLDETVLDNSPVQARMLVEGTCASGFPAAWDGWLAERAARAVPGAAEFIRAARSLRDAEGRSVRVLFITNRECRARAGSADACPQKADTLANLRALGLDSATLETDLMLKGERPEWTSEKRSRREVVARDYRILLNVGDDLGDFMPGVRRQSLASREDARCAHQDWWGSRWFLLPNPMYGSWEQVLGEEPDAYLLLPPASRAGCEPR